MWPFCQTNNNDDLREDDYNAKVPELAPLLDQLVEAERRAQAKARNEEKLARQAEARNRITQQRLREVHLVVQMTALEAEEARKRAALEQDQKNDVRDIRRELARLYREDQDRREKERQEAEEAKGRAIMMEKERELEALRLEGEEGRRRAALQEEQLHTLLEVQNAAVQERVDLRVGAVERESERRRVGWFAGLSLSWATNPSGPASGPRRGVKRPRQEDDDLEEETSPQEPEVKRARKDDQPEYDSDDDIARI